MPSFDFDLPYPSSREPVVARNLVATSNPVAATAGLDMLRRGGNAVDAAIATAACMTVVEPTSNGIGSDAFALVWEGGDPTSTVDRPRIRGYNGSGRSPASLDPSTFAGETSIPRLGWGPVTVPGAVARGRTSPDVTADCPSRISSNRRSTTRRRDISSRPGRPRSGDGRPRTTTDAMTGAGRSCSTASRRVRDCASDCPTKHARFAPSRRARARRSIAARSPPRSRRPRDGRVVRCDRTTSRRTRRSRSTRSRWTIEGPRCTRSLPTADLAALVGSVSFDTSISPNSLRTIRVRCTSRSRR